jgi:DNA-binding MarR family transcriptional regulator
MDDRAATPALRLTERDIKILRWLSGFGGATANQIARRFRAGYSYTARRLTQLRAAGLLSRERFLYHRGGLYAVTAEGLAVIGADLPVPELSLSAAVHDLAVTDAAIDAELAGEKVITKRQMQALEVVAGADDLIYAVGLADGDRHFPDLVLERVDGRWAVEVEVTDARTELLEAILRAYAGAEHLAGVIYRVAPTVHADRIQRAAAAHELGARLELHQLEAPVD